MRLVKVLSDREHDPTQKITLPSTQDYLAFEFRGTSFKTRPDRLVYLYRLQGFETQWRQTREERVEYTDLPVGEYVFQVQAVDRNLNYSEDPAALEISVHLPYRQIGGLGLALVGLAAASGYGIRRRRERDRAREQLVRERRQRIEVQSHDIEQWTLDDFIEQSLGMRLLFEEMG